MITAFAVCGLCRPGFQIVADGRLKVDQPLELGVASNAEQAAHALSARRRAGATRSIVVDVQPVLARRLAAYPAHAALLSQHPVVVGSSDVVALLKIEIASVHNRVECDVARSGLSRLAIAADVDAGLMIVPVAVMPVDPPLGPANGAHAGRMRFTHMKSLPKVTPW